MLDDKIRHDQEIINKASEKNVLQKILKRYRRYWLRYCEQAFFAQKVSKSDTNRH